MVLFSLEEPICPKLGGPPLRADLHRSKCHRLDIQLNFPLNHCSWSKVHRDALGAVAETLDLHQMGARGNPGDADCPGLV